MQTSKFLVAIGTAMAVILPLQVQTAPDDEAQAQMRAALRQKMEEMNATTAKPAAVTPVAVTPAPVAPAPAPQPVPVAPPPPAATASPKIVMYEKPADAPSPADDAEAAKAREAVRQKLNELQTGAPQTAAVAPQTAVVAPQTAVVAPQTPVVAPVPAPSVEKPMAPVPPPADEAALASAEAAVRNKLAALQTAPPPKVVATPAGKASPAVVTASEYAPIQPPASSLSAAKQARLAELLSRYKADTITALEYHTQRAAIIAEP